MSWFWYKMLNDERTMVICPMSDGTVVSGYADSIPEYLAWLAEGNTPEPWQPE